MRKSDSSEIIDKNMAVTVQRTPSGKYNFNLSRVFVYALNVAIYYKLWNGICVIADTSRDDIFITLLTFR